MKVALCYNSSVVNIKWNLPFLPRKGETMSLSQLISEKQNNKLCQNRDYFTIAHIAWFPSKRSSQSLIEILLE